MKQDPNTPPIGRQPYNRQISPSKQHPWYGTINGATVAHGALGPMAMVGGEQFTDEQLRALEAKGIDPATVDAMLVKRQADKNREISVPLGSLPPVFAFDCPVIGKRGEKVRVIAPSGDAKLVMPDGWAHRPQRIARDMWGNPA